MRFSGFTAFLPLCLGTLAVVGSMCADAQERLGGADANRLMIEAIGTASVPPDTVHLMMKMEYESGLAADATRLGEERLHEFLAAVEALRVPDLTYQVSNSPITLAQGGRGAVTGFVYTRNIVFTLPLRQPGQTTKDIDPVIARLEDLGARYNSHCVTCIGSG
jgi:uncharacterized protein YggE